MYVIFILYIQSFRLEIYCAGFTRVSLPTFNSKCSLVVRRIANKFIVHHFWLQIMHSRPLMLYLLQLIQWLSLQRVLWPSRLINGLLNIISFFNVLLFWFFCKSASSLSIKICITITEHLVSLWLLQHHNRIFDFLLIYRISGLLFSIHFHK